MSGGAVYPGWRACLFPLDQIRSGGLSLPLQQSEFSVESRSAQGPGRRQMQLEEGTDRRPKAEDNTGYR